MTPDELAAYNAKFGLGNPMGPAAQVTLPPAGQEPLSQLRPDTINPAMPQAAGLQLPSGIGDPMGPPTLKPGQVIDTAPDMPIAPSPPPGAPPPMGPEHDPSMQLRMPSMAPPARAVPAQWVPKLRVVEPGRPIPEEAKQDQYQGLEKQQDAAAIQSQAQAREGRLEAARYDLVSADLEDQASAIRAREAGRRAALEGAVARYDDMARRAAEQGEVDPNRFWAQRGAGPQLMATIGIALSQAGASLTGGPNAALALVENAIDRDIAAQRMNIDKRRGDLADQRGLLADMRAQFGDERVAEAAAKDAYLQHAQMRINSLLASTKSEEARARGQELSGQIDMKRGLLRQQIADRETDKIEKQTEQFVPAHSVGGGAGIAPVTKEQDSRMVTLDDGTTMQMRDAEDAKKARAQLAAVRKIEKIATDLDKVRGNAGTYLPGTESAAEAKRLGGQLLFAIKDAEQTGALDKGAVEVVRETLGTPDGLFSRAGQRAIGYAKDARESFNSYVKANGSRVVREGYATDAATGRVVPTQAYEGKSAASALVPRGFKAVDGSEPYRPKQPPIKTYDAAAIQTKLDERKKGGK